jgi:hypothetical protein
VKRIALAGEHAPRQRHGRQEIAARGMAVGADLRVAHDAREEKLVPSDRQRVADFRHRIFSIERGRKPVDGRDRHVIDVGFLLADPFLQVFQVVCHVRAPPVDSKFSRA